MDRLEAISWSFRLKDTKVQFCRKAGDKTVAEAVFDSGKLTVNLMYSYKDKPLRLTSEASVGSLIEMILLPHRVELRTDGITADEEWPVGESMFTDAPFTVKNTDIEVSRVRYGSESSDVISTFTGAEGWRPGNGVFVGDCMPYSHNGRYHLMFLKDRHHHGSKWGLGAHQWEHISSSDLIHWDIHPTAVAVDEQWEGSICTGSWIFFGGRHLLYYAVRTCDGSSAVLCRSVSDDGIRFTKDNSFGFSLSDRYNNVSARDPKMIVGEDGKLHMLVTTTDMTTGHGCLAHLISDDGKTFVEIGNIYTANNNSEPECPDHFKFGKYYYLVFSHGATTQYRVSEKQFTDWEAPCDSPVIPCGTVPKGAVWNGRLIFAGFSSENCYGGVCTFAEALQEDDGRLTFRKPSETEMLPCGKNI